MKKYEKYETMNMYNMYDMNMTLIVNIWIDEYMNIWYGLQAIVDEQWQNYFKDFLTLMNMSWTQFNIAPQKTWSTKGHTCHSRKHPLRHKSWNHTRQAAFTSW